MAVTINASTTTGLVQSADTSGIIELQNNGTTKLTVNSSGATIPTAIVTTLSDGTNSTSATNPIRGSAKAWVNFDGNTSGTIRSSFNVSSITVNTTGDYTVNFTNALANANYSALATAELGGVGDFAIACTSDTQTARTSSLVRIRVGNSSGGSANTNTVGVSVFST